MFSGKVWRNTVCTRKGYAASVSQLRWQRLRYISHFSNRRLGAKDPLSSRRRFIQRFLRETLKEKNDGCFDDSGDQTLTWFM